LIDAGGDTTRNLLSAGMLALLDNPQQFDWLTADLPGRLASAREELLRWCSPVIYMRRRVTRDVELAGKKLRAGDKAVMYFGSANRDAAKFSEPTSLICRASPMSTSRSAPGRMAASASTLRASKLTPCWKKC